MHTSTTGHSACCGQTGTGRPAAGVLERPRYFPRQLITPDELTLEADYFRDRLRRHNRYLHGWGVVCGALVGVVPAEGTDDSTEPWLVRVEPGYVLGPYGDEIVIEEAREVSLRGGVVSGCQDAAMTDLDDPWCGEVYVRERTGPLYVAVRYAECPARPVHAQPSGCDCDQQTCEYSRFRDGYEIGILDRCPGTSLPSAGEPGAVSLSCPESPGSPWVGLAEVAVDKDGTVTRIDNCSCRRIVPSARDTWHRCDGTDRDHPPRTTSAAEAVPEREPEPEPKRRRATRAVQAPAE